jgi:hypothetical protein
MNSYLTVSKISMSIVLAILSLLCASCYDVEINDKLRLVNLSNDTVSVLYSNIRSGDLTPNHVAFFLDDYNLIGPRDTSLISLLGNNNAWHDYIKGGGNKKLFIFVFKIDTLKKYEKVYSMNELVEAGKYVKLLQYSERELVRKHWVIDFK